MAARFRFRLEALLKLRKALEEDAQRALGKAIQARNLLQTRLEHMQKEHEEVRNSRRNAPGETIDLDRWKAIERYLVVLERLMVQLNQELQQAEVRVLEARQALTKAHQAHLMLVRLKERRKEQHDREVMLEEFRIQDELAVLRHRFSTQPFQEVTP